MSLLSFQQTHDTMHTIIIHTRTSSNSQYLVKCESTLPPGVRHNILFSTNAEVYDGEYL